MSTSMIAPRPLPYMPKDGAPYLQRTVFNTSPTHRNRLACIVRMLEEHEQTTPLRILEVGCGLGNISIPIASLGYAVQAIDIHEPSVAAAQERNPFPNLQFRHAAVSEVDLREFDVIILTEVLEHVTAFRDMLGGIHAAMKPGAMLILTVPNGWGLAELLCRPSYFLKRSRAGARFVTAIKKMLGTRDVTTANEHTPHVNFFTLGTLESLFKDMRFRVLSFHRCFVTWIFWETLFSERGLPDAWAEKDFARSQRTPPAFCGFWAFVLQKEFEQEQGTPGLPNA
jgi:2-polyprenyl-3-methyl-5-hydroxy-6-metoxy-1,4-benzoquinol methylase